MEIQCLECLCKFRRITDTHLNKHKISKYEYLKKHYCYDIVEQYSCGKSASLIAQEISKVSDGSIRPIKKDILETLRTEGAAIRNTSEAMSAWNKQNNGPWNKGLTKEAHPSIEKYAQSRMGANNPFHKTHPSKRIDSYYKTLSKEEVSILRKRIGKTLREKYLSGEIVPWSKLNPEKFAAVHIKMISGFQHYLAKSESLVFPRSKMEIKIGELLSELKIDFVAQKHIKNVGVFDYEISDLKIILEYHGDYWHCNPSVYDKDYYNQKKKKFAHELWSKDSKRKTRLEKLGYKVLVFWESDLRKLTDSQIKEKLLNEINQNLSN